MNWCVLLKSSDKVDFCTLTSTASTTTLRTLLWRHVYKPLDKHDGHEAWQQSELSSWTEVCWSIGSRSYVDLQRNYILSGSISHNTLPETFLCSTNSHLVQASCFTWPTAVANLFSSRIFWVTNFRLSYHLQMTTSHLFVLKPIFYHIYCFLSWPLSSSFDVRLGILHYWIFGVSECHEVSAFFYLELLNKRFHCIVVSTVNFVWLLWRAVLVMLFGTPNHIIGIYISWRSMVTTWLIAISYATVSGHMILGVRPYCRYQSFSFPGRSHFTIDSKPSVTCLAIFGYLRIPQLITTAQGFW